MSIKRTGKIIISFMLGSAFGSAIALLYAPKAGKYLRNDISRKTNELIEDGRKITYDTWNGIQQRAERTIESTGDFINTSMEKISRKTEKVKDALSSGFKS
jgi:gas vesicle protein